MTPLAQPDPHSDATSAHETSVVAFPKEWHDRAQVPLEPQRRLQMMPPRGASDLERLVQRIA